MDSLNIFLSSGNILTPRGGLNLVGPVRFANIYTLTSNAPGAGAFTLPASVTSFVANTYGGGGGGGGSIRTQISFFNTVECVEQGSGGGGGAKAGATYTNNGSGAVDFTTVIGSGGAGGAATELGGASSTTPTSITTSGTNILTANGGLGGTKGIVFTAGVGGAGGTVTANGNITNWTKSVDINNAGIVGVTTAVPGCGNSLAVPGGAGGNVGGFQILPLTGTEGQGGSPSDGNPPVGGGGGSEPGGGGGGAGNNTAQSLGQQQTGGSGANGRIIIQIFAPSGLTNANFNLTGFTFTDNGPVIFNTYTLTSNATGAGAFTLPPSVTTFTARAFGAGGSGGGSDLAGSFGQAQSISGAGGGGAGQAVGAFTKTTAGSQAFTTSVPGTTAGTSEATAGTMGNSCTITATTGSTVICTSTGGSGGGAGIMGQSGGAGGAGGTGSSMDLTGWTRIDASTSGGGGTNGTIVTSNSSPFLTNAVGGAGGNIGGFQILPLTGTEGQGGVTHTQPGSAGQTALNGNPGSVPGGGGSGAGARTVTPSGFAIASYRGAGGTGAEGRVIIQLIAPSGLTEANFNLTGFGLVDNGPV